MPERGQVMAMETVPYGYGLCESKKPMNRIMQPLHSHTYGHENPD